MNPVKTRIEVEEALKRLDEAASFKPATRADHVILQGCSELLQSVVKEWRAFKAAELAEKKTAEEQEPPPAN
jgi:hypothetical protein